MKGKRHRRIAAMVVLALIAVSCGSGHGGTPTATTAAGSATTASATATTATTAAPTVKFGTLDSPCGPGTDKGATAPGVTDTSITIGYGDDAGYAAAPGLNKEMSDAMKAMIQWCNDQGGINGRKITGNYYDAKLLQVTQAVTQACNDKVFMLVGQGWAFDAGQEKLRIDCKLSTIPTYSVSTAFAHGSGMEQPAPNPGDEVTASGAFQIAQLFPDAIKKATFVFAEYPPTRETRDKYESGFPKAGWNFLKCDQVYNIAGESDWKPFASNLKACGVQAVVWVGSPEPNLENLLTASKQVGFAPAVWFTDANHYDAGFAKWNGQNGGAGDGVYVRMAYVPFELASQAPAVQQYMDLVNKGGGKVALLGEQAASAFLLWATGVKACGSTVTAKCVLDSAAKQTGWTGGGMQTATNPGTNDGPSCGMLVKMNGPQWAKVYPTDKLFDCNDKYLIKGITSPALTAAKLDANRVATQFGQFTPA